MNRTISILQLKIIASIYVLGLVLTSCGPAETHRWTGADSLRIIEETMAYRVEADSFHRFSEQSPFHRDTTISYNGLKWFPVDVKYYFLSRLYPYEQPEIVEVMGTRGETREYLRYGYFRLSIDGKTHKLNVYKMTPKDPQRYASYQDHLSVWFTDETTGVETYEVGRYLEVGTQHPDPDHLYAINFNMAYNPYCAYSPLYSCAIPLKEDHLNFAIRAGEKKYHEDGVH